LEDAARDWCGVRRANAVLEVHDDGDLGILVWGEPHEPPVSVERAVRADLAELGGARLAADSDAVRLPSEGCASGVGRDAHRLADHLEVSIIDGQVPV